MARPTALALVPPARQTIPLKYSVIVCAYNEEAYLPACLHSLLAQTRRPDEIMVVNNASSDRTRLAAMRISGVRVIDEPRRGLVWAREAGRRASTGDVLVYVDADCRAPLQWFERLVATCENGEPAAVSGSYRFYDWDLPAACCCACTTGRSRRSHTFSSRIC